MTASEKRYLTADITVEIGGQAHVIRSRRDLREVDRLVRQHFALLKRRQASARPREIAAMLKAGVMAAEVARRIGVSRQRVSQIKMRLQSEDMAESGDVTSPQ